MKKFILLCTMMSVAGSVFAAASKEDVTAAAKKLGEQANYSWSSTVTVPEGRQFRPGPTEGMAEKDGYMCVKMERRNTTTEIFKKGDKAAYTDRDGAWQSLADAENAEGPGRFMAATVQNLQTPVEQATEIAAGVKEFKQDGDAIAGELTEEAAKELMRFRRGRGGQGQGQGPDIANAKGSVKFWIKDGVLAKYELKVSGSMDFNGNNFDLDRTTTVEIKDVGSTKIEVPEAAKAKLS